MDRGYIKQSIKKLISIIEQKLNQTFIIHNYKIVYEKQCNCNKTNSKISDNTNTKKNYNNL